MNALEWADALDVEGGNTNNKIAEVLRRQHEVIVELRYALTWIARVNAMGYEYQAVAEQALKDTEGLV